MKYLPMMAQVLLLTTLGAGNAMAVEEAKYTVLLEDDKFELREYAPHIVAETRVTADFEDAGDLAFSRLFNYITGSNTSSQDIAMTAPVGQEAAGEKIDMTAPVGQHNDDGRWAVSFMMPASYTMETLPQPNDSTVKLRQVPVHYVATIRYSGFWSEKGYRKNLAKLESWIEGRGLKVTGEPVWARYNAPFVPWFMRRNEVLMPIEQPQEQG